AGRRAASAAPSGRRPAGTRGDPRGARRVRSPPRAGGGMTTFRGVDHVGVGVADMDGAVSFYGRAGFGEVVFDYTGEVPGPDRRARSRRLATPHATPGAPRRD